MHFCSPEIPYETLVRSRRKNSHVLKRIFTMDEQQELVASNMGFEYSIPNLCLVHRSDSNDEGMDQHQKLELWTKLGYLPELRGQMFNYPQDFLIRRQRVLVECIDKIWPLDIPEPELVDFSMVDLILTIN